MGSTEKKYIFVTRRVANSVIPTDMCVNPPFLSLSLVTFAASSIALHAPFLPKWFLPLFLSTASHHLISPF